MNWLYTVCYIIWILFQLIAAMDGESQDMIVPVDPGNYTNSYHWTCFPDNESLYC